MNRLFRTFALIALFGLLTAGNADAKQRRFHCVEGKADSMTEIRGSGDEFPPGLGCDTDGVKDKVCEFRASCPICYFSSPNCLAPCYIEPEYEWAVVERDKKTTITVAGEKLTFLCRRKPRR